MSMQPNIKSNLATPFRGKSGFSGWLAHSRATRERPRDPKIRVRLLHLNHNILREVLLYYRALFVRTSKRPYAWLAITHVCCALRRLALDHEPLWSDLVVTQPDCVEAMVARSGTAPLTIWLKDSRSSYPASRLPTLEAILPRILPRLRSLELEVHLQTYQYFLAMLEKKNTLGSIGSAAMLKYLNVRFYDDAVVTRGHYGPYDFWLVRSAAEGSGTFSGFIFPWEDPILRNITRTLRSLTLLCRSDQCLPPTARPSLIDFLEILVEFRQLEELGLSYALPPCVGSASNGLLRNFRPTVLPKLHYLSLRSFRAEEVFKFLMYIDMPLLRYLSICCHLHLSAPHHDDVVALQRALAPKLSSVVAGAGRGVPWDDLQIQCLDADGPQTCVSVGGKNAEGCKWSLKLYTPDHTQHLVVGESIAQLVQALPLRSVTKLTYNSSVASKVAGTPKLPFATIHQAARAFRSLDAVTSVYVNTPSVDLFGETLAMDAFDWKFNESGIPVKQPLEDVWLTIPDDEGDLQAGRPPPIVETSQVAPKPWFVLPNLTHVPGIGDRWDVIRLYLKMRRAEEFRCLRLAYEDLFSEEAELKKDIPETLLLKFGFRETDRVEIRYLWET